MADAALIINFDRKGCLGGVKPFSRHFIKTIQHIVLHPKAVSTETVKNPVSYKLVCVKIVSVLVGTVQSRNGRILERNLKDLSGT